MWAGKAANFRINALVHADELCQNIRWGLPYFITLLRPLHLNFDQLYNFQQVSFRPPQISRYRTIKLILYIFGEPATVPSSWYEKEQCANSGNFNFLLLFSNCHSQLELVFASYNGPAAWQAGRQTYILVTSDSLCEMPASHITRRISKSATTFGLCICACARVDGRTGLLCQSCTAHE